MSDPSPDPSPQPIDPGGPAPYPEIAPPATPTESPPGPDFPDDGRPYDAR